MEGEENLSLPSLAGHGGIGSGPLSCGRGGKWGAPLMSWGGARKLPELCPELPLDDTSPCHRPSRPVQIIIRNWAFIELLC